MKHVTTRLGLVIGMSMLVAAWLGAGRATSVEAGAPIGTAPAAALVRTHVDPAPLASAAIDRGEHRTSLMATIVVREADEADDTDDDDDPTGTTIEIALPVMRSLAVERAKTETPPASPEIPLTAVPVRC